jgi:hypothetical protein
MCKADLVLFTIFISGSKMYIYIYIYLFIYLFMYIYLCMCVCFFVYVLFTAQKRCIPIAELNIYFICACTFYNNHYVVSDLMLKHISF